MSETKPREWPGNKVDIQKYLKLHDELCDILEERGSTESDIVNASVGMWGAFQVMDERLSAAMNHLKEMADALELATSFQEKAKNFIYHYEDCDALIDEESEGPCACGMETFAHDNYISHGMAKAQLESYKSFLSSIESEAGE